MTNVVDFEANPGIPEFIKTPSSRRIIFALEDVFSLRELMLLRGGYGTGKTLCLQHFTKERWEMVTFATLNPATKSLTGALRVICEALKPICNNNPFMGRIGDVSMGPALAYGRIRRVFENISDHHGQALLIVDEAQHAQPDVLETLRALFDEGVCGLVIAGNYRLFNQRRSRMEAADFGALRSRAYHVIDIPSPTAEDIDAVLDAYRIVSKRSRELLRQRAETGGLREVARVIEKARVLSGAAIVGYKHVKDAARTTGSSASNWSGRRR